MRARILFAAAAAALAAVWLAGADGAPAGGKAAADDAHDFVFFGETRPVLVRLHVHLDGKPLGKAYDELVDYLFKYLDTDKNGVLSKAELERMPPPQVLFNNGAFFNLRVAPAGRAAPGRAPEGNMRRADLADYLRRNGAPPFQLVYSGANSANAGAQVVFANGLVGQPPQTEDINEALFKLLDTNKDGKLSKEELAAAPEVLAKLDLDEDEMISMEELLPGSNPNGGVVGFVPVAPGGTMPQTNKPGPFLALGPGESSSRLARELLTRYGNGKKTLTRADLGLDKEAFEALDADGDGTLDSEELARFGDRPADLEAVVYFGQRRPNQAPVEMVQPGGRAGGLAGKARLGNDGGLTLALGNTRLEMRLGGQAVPGNGAGIRQQYIAQFKQADRDNNGYLDENEARASPFFRNTFKLMDANGDGKLFENEMLAYVDAMIGLQVKAMAAVASVNITDEGKGVFDLIDTNHDGRLSVRELRNAVKLVAELDQDGDGAVSRQEIPKSYQVTVQRGPANGGGGGFGPRRVVFAGGGRRFGNRPIPTSTAGPLWFRKMDRNHDGDVSRREFLGTDEEFRRIDADGDGLISAEEAERYDAQMRKEREKGPGR
jgi:Ca2+-binding EF-hand superfamily protein